MLSRMVSKRPQDRPSWDEVLKLFSKPNTSSAVAHPSVSAAVEAAIARLEKEEAQHLSALQQQSERQRTANLYRHSCETLLESLNPLMEQFNRQFQHGKITCESLGRANHYSVPSGPTISISFFEPKKSGIKVRGGEIIGGGWIGIAEGRSANLVLLKYPLASGTSISTIKCDTQPESHRSSHTTSPTTWSTALPNC